MIRSSIVALVFVLLARSAHAAPGEVVMEIEDEPSETPTPAPAPKPAPIVNAAGRQPIAVPEAVPGPETSGPETSVATSVVTPTVTPAETEAAAAKVEVPVDELALLRARVEALEAERKVRATRPRPRLGPLLRGNPAPRPDVAPTQIGFGPGQGIDQWGVRISGYVQTQYQWSQLSEDQLQQGGTPLNQNRFLIRRGRVRLSGDWRFVAFDLELDGSTTRGPFVGIRQANVSVLWILPPGEDSELSLLQLRLRCRLAGATQQQASEYRTRYKPNVAPAVAGLTADGAEAAAVSVKAGTELALRVAWAVCPVEAVCGDGLCSLDESIDNCAGDCTDSAGCSGAETYLRFDPITLELAESREAIGVAWFATDGTYTQARTGRAADELVATSDNAWTAPDAAGPVTLWVVLRDDRGAAGWRRVDVEVAP